MANTLEMYSFVKYCKGKWKQFLSKVGKWYHSTEVFLFHRSNTRESSCKFNCLLLSDLKMLR